jgi:AcrR family transcriptional regulator
MIQWCVSKFLVHVNIDCTYECNENKMSRTYTLKRRADQQADTRRRIVEAAVDLHGSVGPARTTVSMVAERAGVQRHTFYAHFPDERSLFLACSGLFSEREPMPDAGPWREIADTAARLTTGLGAIYEWYRRNAGILAAVISDSEHHALTREVNDLRAGPVIATWRAVLGETLDAPQRALLDLALSFHTWRTLAQEGGSSEPAILMARAIVGARAKPKAR